MFSIMDSKIYQNIDSRNVAKYLILEGNIGDIQHILGNAAKISIKISNNFYKKIKYIFKNNVEYSLVFLNILSCLAQIFLKCIKMYDTFQKA